MLRPSENIPDDFIPVCKASVQRKLCDMALSSLDREGVVVPRSTLENAHGWLIAALDCREWKWDSDQFNAAHETARELESLLAAAPQPEPVPMGPVGVIYGEPGNPLAEWTDKLWLVWSHENRAFWPQNRCGYVPLEQAGQFSFAEAIEIVTDNNWWITGVPEETMMPLPQPPREGKDEG